MRPPAQVRWLRRLRLGRAGAHRLPPPSGPSAELRRDQGAAGADPHPRDLVGARVRLANELRAQLDAFWPGAAQVFADVDSPIGLAFGALPGPRGCAGAWREAHGGFPRPSWLLRTALGRRAAGAAAHRAGRSRRSPGGRGTQGAVLGLVAALKPIVEQIRELTSQIAGAVRAHPHGRSSCRCSKTPSRW